MKFPWRVRFQKPIEHRDCYECGGGWAFQWPVRVYRAYTDTSVAALFTKAWVEETIRAAAYAPVIAETGFFSKEGIINIPNVQRPVPADGHNYSETEFWKVGHEFTDAYKDET